MTRKNIRNSGILLQATLLLMSAVLLSGCSSKGTLAIRNFADNYMADESFEGLDFIVFNPVDSLSRLFYRVPLQKLKVLSEKDKISYLSFRIEYQLFDGITKGRLVDSGSVTVVDSLIFSGTKSDSLNIKAPFGRDYLLNLQFTDLVGHTIHTELIRIPRSKDNLSCDYLLTDKNNHPLMRNFVYRDEQFYLRTNTGAKEEIKLTRTGIYNKEAAKAPFTYGGDPMQSIPDAAEPELQKSGGPFAGPFSFSEEGIIKAGSGPDRFTIFRFYDGFPKIGSSGVMRESLRYISTDEEFSEMMQMQPKAAVDRFWLKQAGSPDRALSQIKRYYSRVERANELFSLTGEGWKSDRGMIYIVFGQPSVVYINEEIEEWTYGDQGNLQSVKFYFQPVSSASGDTDYHLIRLEEYRRPWHLAVSNWRR
ncbi:MAG: GWxTD domain-containing protein [Bacteroidales bacterium]|nr:GWxTD domain-containing protein [Bacteroidales bacterium]